MQPTGGSAQPEDVDHRPAQEATSELARMGIDPGSLGLDPAPVPGPAPTVPAVGVAPMPPGPARLLSPTALPAPAPGDLRTQALPVIGPTLYDTARPPSSAVVAPSIPQPRAVRAPESGYPAARPPDAAAGTTLSRPLGGPEAGPLAGAAAPGLSGSPTRAWPAGPPVTPGPAGSPTPTGSAGPARPGGPGSWPGQAGERHGIVRPSGWRRTVRALSFGLVEPGAVAALERERRLVARIRTRQRAPRLIAFVAGKGGVGNTTTAAGVALALDALRHDSTAIVDAQHGAGSIARRLADRAAPTASQLTERTDPDPIREPLRLNGSLGVVDGSPWHDPQPGGELVHLLEQLGERFAFTVVDLGDDLGATSGTVLRRVDQVVVVTSPTDDAVTATGMAIRRIYQAHPYHLATVVVALACVGRHPYRPAVRRLNDELGVPQNRIIPVPFDPLLAVGRRIEPAGLRPATREAYLRLGGLLAAPATPDQGRQAHPPAGTPR